MSVVSIFVGSSVSENKIFQFCKNIALISNEHIITYEYIFFAINSIFRFPKDCSSKYHLRYFTGSDLELIILKSNDINEVAVTDPNVGNHWILPERILSDTIFFNSSREMVEYLAWLILSIITIRFQWRAL